MVRIGCEELRLDCMHDLTQTPELPNCACLLPPPVEPQHAILVGHDITGAKNAHIAADGNHIQEERTTANPSRQSSSGPLQLHVRWITSGCSVRFSKITLLPCLKSVCLYGVPTVEATLLIDPILRDRFIAHWG